MPRTLSYADAARLLGGDRSPLVTALDKLSGGALLGAAVAVPAALALFDAKVEFIRLSHELVRGFSERRSGLSRYGRTERLAAAHRVLVVAAFFEALRKAELPFRFEDLELTEWEQVAVAGAHGSDHGPLLRAFFRAEVPAPGPAQPYDAFRTALGSYYKDIADRLRRFVVGLAAWEWLGVVQQRRFQEILETLPLQAADQHQELLGRLAGEFPEVAFWAGLREHAGTRAEVRELAVALGDLDRLLRGISTGRAPDERRLALATAYAAELDRSVVESGDVPTGIRVPTLGSAYVPPLYRVAGLAPQARPSDESWWQNQPVRDDLSGFLTGYLTTPGAVEAPLLVLGQPGSGKSLLIRVLAARLPAADFLPVRVVLRDVPAVDLQDQIEYAIRAATGERLDWPALARSAGDALPVVLLDGFDELLQATGVSQTDYLLKVGAFQRREADQGRPVVVVVTSRTSVADRARPPDGSVAVRLEPFDEARIAAWLAHWNAVNADQFASRGVTPLDLSTVLAHGELAKQPLLLLMLALYDADGNALRSAGELRQDELYERLLRRFARREVDKHRSGLPDRELERAVEAELRRLSVAALAMFNRNAQWVTEAELETDLLALFGATPASATAADLRAPLRHAEIVLGRFFFVHRSRAFRDDERLETYEFLHATFGEFLVARFTWQALLDVAARESAATMSFGGGAADDDLLHAVLSYAALSGRAPILGFLAGLMSAADAGRRETLVDLLVRLFQGAHHTRPARRFDAYQPRGLPVPARHAAYSVNLLLLAVCAAGTLHGSRLYPDRNVVPVWHRETLLWQSQLNSEDWASLVGTLALDRLWTEDGGRDIALRIAADPTGRTTPPVDPVWTYGIEQTRRYRWYQSSKESFEYLRQEAHLRCAIGDDLLVHALEPLAAALPSVVNTVAPEARTSVARELLRTMVAPSLLSSVSERRDAYLRCQQLIGDISGIIGDDDAERNRLVRLVLDRLAADLELPPRVVAEVLDRFDHFDLVRNAVAVFRCGSAILGRDSAADAGVSVLLLSLADDRLVPDSGRHLMVEVILRIAELGHLVAPDLPPVDLTDVLAARPDLRVRYEDVWSRPSWAGYRSADAPP